MLRFALLSIGLLLACSNGSAEIVFSEFDLATDLSNLPTAPTSIGTLALGANEVEGALVQGEVNELDIDPDIFTFTIGAGQVLDSVILLDFEGDGHFFGLDDGTTSDFGNGTQLLIATLVGDAGTLNINLLDLTTAQQNFGGQGVTAPLGAGDYTIWVQENLAEFNVFTYTVQLNTSAAAVPEPGCFVALVGLSVAAITQRRRRRTN
ncbi:hypothetical protein [Stieleria varia]|uniref:PEP-CTERM protein-sorting domain-containing protein n=1 Tax=Stieleria varia TaxID=2528005 RepID=A0A5C6B2E6_9BACT|nr:hypothetical protein [Stieleria varia]TWU05592.1 hypothetical protein Pla52n_13070 [Stieleria varia]